jgi:hypothetical protein
MSNNIKGLYFVWEESPETPCLEAISMDEEKLKNMIPLLKEKLNSNDEIIIRAVDLYIAQLLNNKILLSNAVAFTDNYPFEDKLYAINLCHNNNFVDQTLIFVLDNIDIKELENFKISSSLKIENISDNPIKFDMLYEEGVMNA